MDRSVFHAWLSAAEDTGINEVLSESGDAGEHAWDSKNIFLSAMSFKFHKELSAEFLILRARFRSKIDRLLAPSDCWKVRPDFFLGAPECECFELPLE